MWKSSIGFALVLGTACATVPPMSAEKHDEVAAKEHQIAEADREKYDPKATDIPPECGPLAPSPSPAGSLTTTELDAPCWREFGNPTEHFLTEAQRHERIAKAHEAASAAQRDAEERACAGVSEWDRHTSPFSHHDDIKRVTVDTDSSGKAVGVTVEFAAVRGLTAPWLQREVTCHLAIDAALGNVVPERDDCPLVPKGVRAEVIPESTGTLVVLRGDSQPVVTEIIRRVLKTSEDKVGTPVASH